MLATNRMSSIPSVMLGALAGVLPMCLTIENYSSLATRRVNV